jgi:hypothetical protein
MHYRLVMPEDRAAASILHETLKHLRAKAEMRRDVSRLQFACCAPEKFDLLQAASQPAVVTSS